MSRKLSAKELKRKARWGGTARVNPGACEERFQGKAKPTGDGGKAT